MVFLGLCCLADCINVCLKVFWSLYDVAGCVIVMLEIDLLAVAWLIWLIIKYL